MKKRIATILRRAANRLDPSLVMTIKLDESDLADIRSMIDSRISEALAGY